MLGDMARAEGMVRCEVRRPDRLPQPIDLDEAGLAHIERLEEISIAVLVMLQHLAPAERTVADAQVASSSSYDISTLRQFLLLHAVLLLPDVFGMRHDEIAGVA